MTSRPRLLLAASILLLELARSSPFTSVSFASSNTTPEKVLLKAKRGDEHKPDPPFWQCQAPYSSVLRPTDGGRIPSMNFTNIYGSNESVTGPYGYVDASVAGITVPHQEVALIERANWSGDKLKSGVIGLASRLTTAQLPGEKRYSPIFESMYNKTHQIAPVYSLALQRGANAGYLAFGGLPPVEFDNEFASTNFTGIAYYGESPRRRFNPIKPDNYELNGKTHESNYTAFVDSGTYALRLPVPLANDINAAL